MRILHLRWVVVAMTLWTLTAAAQPDSDFAVMGFDGHYTIEGYVGPVGPVVIPATIYGWTVTAIDDYAFNGFYSAPNVTSITIPDTVTSIGDLTFQGCGSLAQVTLGTNVNSIGQYAFRDCSSLTSMVIPDSVTSIGMDAFYNCTGMTNLVIGSGVTNIDSWAFTYCNPTRLVIPAGSPASAITRWAACTT